MIRICICGGGSLGHVCAGVLASNHDVSVNVFTRKPDLWNNTIKVKDFNGKRYLGKLAVISNNPEEAVKNCDIIFLCLPGYAIENELNSIKPFISSNTIVGSIVCSSGFFFFAHKILDVDAKLFGFQRTPFIARVEKYGHSANLLGYKHQVSIAVENILDNEAFKLTVEKLWQTPVKLLNSFYEVSLSNSNPILHTGRLYSMFHNWDGSPFDHNILFYEEWTAESSNTIIEMDREFFRLLEKLPITQGSIIPLLDYYECSDAQSLTKKIQNISAFKGILSPMKEVQDGWVPDFENRYFTEDFPFGLKFINDLAKDKGVCTPMINKVYEWGIQMINGYLI